MDDALRAKLCRPLGMVRDIVPVRQEDVAHAAHCLIRHNTTVTFWSRMDIRHRGVKALIPARRRNTSKIACACPAC